MKRPQSTPTIAVLLFSSQPRRSGACCLGTRLPIENHAFRDSIIFAGTREGGAIEVWTCKQRVGPCGSDTPQKINCIRLENNRSRCLRGHSCLLKPIRTTVNFETGFAQTLCKKSAPLCVLISCTYFAVFRKVRCKGNAPRCLYE
jgi:hypothetical protein